MGLPILFPLSLALRIPAMTLSRMMSRSSWAMAAMMANMASPKRLHRAYQLRVDFEELWEIRDEEEARVFLRRWTRSALLSRLEPLRKFARTVREHMDGILGFMRWDGITNANLEGMANKIKLCIHKAFGFHSVSALIGMIHLCCSGINLE